MPNSNPSLPGYSGFHSNLGLQEIIEVGVPLAKPESHFDQVDAANANPRPVAETAKRHDYFSPAIGTRLFHLQCFARKAHLKVRCPRIQHWTGYKPSGD